jgi:hypothetical protein
MLKHQGFYQCLLVNKMLYSNLVHSLWKEPRISSEGVYDQYFYGLNTLGHQMGRSIKCISIGFDVSDQQLLDMLFFMSNLKKKLVIADGRLVTERSIIQISSYYKNMKMLKLMFGNITHQSASFLNQCHQLKKTLHLFLFYNEL